MKAGRIIGIGLLALIGMNGCSDNDKSGLDKSNAVSENVYPVVNHGVRKPRDIIGRVVNEKTKGGFVFIALDHDSTATGIDEAVEISFSNVTSDDPEVLVRQYLNDLLAEGRAAHFIASGFKRMPYFKGPYGIMSNEQKKMYDTLDAGMIITGVIPGGYMLDELTRKGLDKF